MKTFDLKAERRTGLGSRQSRALRSEGRLPIVLCGRGQESLALHVSAKEFENARKQHARVVMLGLDGKQEPAVVHDVDWDTMSQEVAHVDFQRINMSEKIEVEVTIRTKGPSKGEVAGGILIVQMDQVKVRCLPLEIPEVIDVDIRELELHQSMHVKDLKMPAGIEVAGSLDALVLAIVEKKEVIVPVAAEAGAVEPELIVKAPKDGEVAEGAAPGAKGEAAGKDSKDKKPEKK